MKPVPNAVRVDTASYPLCVPQPIFEADGEQLFDFLVLAWVFTAFLRKRFPEAEVTDCALIAGLAAGVPPFELVGMAELMKRKFKDHAKTDQNLKMIDALVETFALGTETPPDQFEEITAYNAQAITEVEALFPCTCGECPPPASKSN